MNLWFKIMTFKICWKYLFARLENTIFAKDQVKNNPKINKARAKRLAGYFNSYYVAGYFPCRARIDTSYMNEI